MRRLATAAAATGAAVIMTTTASASASAPPVVYGSGSYKAATVKPAWIYLGAGGSVQAHITTWSRWDAKAASGSGTLFTNDCKPDCARGHVSRSALRVALSQVKQHGSTRYFYEMKWVAKPVKASQEALFYVAFPGSSANWQSCWPMTSKTGCYERGEFCRSADAGKRGLMGNGVVAVCRSVGGKLRWE